MWKLYAYAYTCVYLYVYVYNCYMYENINSKNIHSFLIFYYFIITLFIKLVLS